MKVKGHQYQWLASGYDLEIGTFLEVASMVIIWRIVFFVHSESHHYYTEVITCHGITIFISAYILFLAGTVYP